MIFSRKALLAPLCVALAGFSLAGCIVEDSDDDEGSGGSASSSPASGPAGSGGGDSSSSDSSSGSTGTGNGTGAGSGGGSAGIGDGVGPSADPNPDQNESGAYDCAGCPEAQVDTADADVGTETVFTFTGKVDGQAGQGKFLVINAIGQFAGGGVFVDPDTGDFTQTAPLFCGENTLKIFFTNESGTSTFVQKVTSGGCLESDVRTTVAWDETTHQWINHLVRFGGTIGDTHTDCYASNSCYPGSITTDWGVEDDMTDNPILDTDAFHNDMGVENIYYPGAEDGLKVLIENDGDTRGLTPKGTLYINVHDKPTYVKQIDVLHPKELLIAAKIDGKAGELEVIDEIYDCAAEYDLGCNADIP